MDRIDRLRQARVELAAAKKRLVFSVLKLLIWVGLVIWLWSKV